MHASLHLSGVAASFGARPLFAGLGIESMAQRLAFTLVEEARFGEDRRLLLHPRRAGLAPLLPLTPPPTALQR